MITAEPSFDIANIQFSIHYFFRDPEMLNGLLQNVQENLKNGGYFIGTCFDGQRVIEYLKDTEERQERDYSVNGYKAIAIRKEYSLLDDEFEWDADADRDSFISNEPKMLGKQISVFQETFGDYYSEYLVNFNYFKWKCSQYDLYPLELFSVL